MAGPEQSVTIAQGAVPDRTNAVFVDEDEAKVGSDGWVEFEGVTGADIVGRAFPIFEIIQLEPAEEANDENDAKGDEDRDSLERLQLHDAGKLKNQGNARLPWFESGVADRRRPMTAAAVRIPLLAKLFGLDTKPDSAS